MPRKSNVIRLPEPKSRVGTDWSPALLKSAFLQGEAGNISRLADLCDNILADDRVNTCFETRVGGLLGLPISFEASGDGRRRTRAVRALEVEEDWWAAFPEPELKKFFTWGLLLGIGFGQLMPTEHEGRFVPRLEPWHARNTRYDWDVREWRAKLDASREQPINPGDGQWIVYTPYGQNRPWASGLWRGLARWWLLKSYAQDDTGRKSEKSGMGVVTCTSDVDDEVRKRLAEDLFEAARNGIVSLPPNFDVKVLDSKEAIRDNQGYINDMANLAISIAILGQNLTTEVSGGSFAATTVHRKVEIQRIRSDAQTGSTCLHDQALEWWAEFNFGDRGLAPWPVWQTDAPTDQKERAGAILTLAQGLEILDRLGIKVDDEQIQTEFSLKWERVAKPEPPAPPAAPAKQDPNPNADDQQQNAEEPPANDSSPLRARAAAKKKTRGPKGQRNGLDYAERVRKNIQDHGSQGLSPTIAGMIAAVRKAKSYDEAKQLIADKYSKLSAPSELASLTEAAIVMAQLGGHLAVQEDN